MGSAIPDVSIAIAQTPLFANASPDVVAALTRSGRVRRLKRGEVLFRRGEIGDYFALLLAGRLRVSNATAAGRDVVLSFIAPGSLAGEIAALDGSERSADVVALEMSDVFVLDRQSLLRAIKGDDEAYLQIIRILTGKVREASAILEANTAELLARACAGLIRLVKLHGKAVEFGSMIDLSIPQKDLGAYLNMTRENANRQLAFLRDEGLITIEESKIIVLDQGGLEDLANEDAS